MVWRRLKKLKWSSNSTSGYLSQETRNTNLKRYLHPHVYCSIIYNSKDMETASVSIDGWTDKENVVCVCACTYTHTHTRTQRHTRECYSAVKKKEILPFRTTCMDPEGILLSEISQTEKGNYHVISLRSGIQKTKQTKWTHRYREETGSCQRNEKMGWQMGKSGQKGETSSYKLIFCSCRYYQ